MFLSFLRCELDTPSHFDIILFFNHIIGEGFQKYTMHGCEDTSTKEILRWCSDNFEAALVLELFSLFLNIWFLCIKVHKNMNNQTSLPLEHLASWPNILKSNWVKWPEKFKQQAYPKYLLLKNLIKPWISNKLIVE